MKLRNILLASGVGLVLMGVAAAQETPPFAFNIGAGFTTPVGGTGTRLNNGWNFDAGAGFNFHPRIGALIQFNDSQFDINRATVNSLGFLPETSISGL